jgi:TRAP-type uncharacterized transport system fused permease subunit
MAMCAFAALTQNYFAAKNRIYESLLLAVVVIVVLRPYWVVSVTGFGNKFVWYAIGTVIFILTYIMQLPRARAAAKKV